MELFCFVLFTSNQLAFNMILSGYQHLHCKDSIYEHELNSLREKHKLSMKKYYISGGLGTWGFILETVHSHSSLYKRWRKLAIRR